MAKRNYVRENVPLSRFGVLVAQLESIVASASQQPPDPLLCFDLLSDLISSIHEEPKESILLWQRKCEDALYSLLTLGARRPVRHLASVAMANIIVKGDSISIYSRASSLQGFLSDGKKSDPQRLAGAAQCLGELYQHFGRRITSGLHETTMITTKLMKFHEDFVRQDALLMLAKALEGSGGGGASLAYAEAFRLITRSAVGDKSFVVRLAAARCLKAFANIGGPGLGVGELDTLASCCVKALEDPVPSVRDAFAEALGFLLALGMNPEAQVQPRGKGPFPPAKKLEGGLQRHLALPFTKASGTRMKDLRIGVTLSWVSFLQAMHLKYQQLDVKLQNYALHILEMLHEDTYVDAHALACILYILRIGVTDQMTEPTQRSFLVFLGKQLESHSSSPSMKIAALRTVSYTLKTLGEVPEEFNQVFDNTVVAAVSHASQLVRVEAALTLRVLAEVDPTSVGGLISFGVTTLGALRENVSFEKGSNLRVELDSLNGQATALAALVSISPRLPLGYPARLPESVLEVSRKMLIESSRHPSAATVEREAGWLLLSSLLSSMPKQELEDQVFDVLSLWAALFSGTPEDETHQSGDLASKICVWSAAVDALTAFIRSFISPNAGNSRVLLQPVLVYLSSALSYIKFLQRKEIYNIKPALDVLIIRVLVAYQSLPDPMAYRSDHPQIVQLCTLPFRDPSRCEESSCLRMLLDKRDAWLGPWIPGRDSFEDELRAFQGGKDGLMPCVWEHEASGFPQPETINKTLVNQMLLCFGVMFASQDNSGMLSLLGIIEQSLKSGKRQTWHAVSLTNICVGLLAGLKALTTTRPQPLGHEILNQVQGIFQNILAEGDICASQRRASSEGLGLLARLGNDMFTARMTRMLLNDLTGTTDTIYAGSIAFALGCIHRSAGGMALSSLVPTTVSSISLLAKSTISGLQIWSLHGLLLTIEAAGFSYVSHVQAALGLAMDILLSEEIGLVDLKQGVGRLINAIVAVLGPELAPGSIFFSRCKSVITEISSRQETATLFESARFTQQLVLFAPQAVSLHTHVQTLLSTLSSRQPSLRHLAVSTLRHLIEKNPVSIIHEQVEVNLLHMLDEETDSEIGDLVRATIMRLLLASCPSCPSRWMLICRNMVLGMSSRQDAVTNHSLDTGSENGPENESRFGEDDENMVSSYKGITLPNYIFDSSRTNPSKAKHLRYRTRVFAAECLSHLPTAVGTDPGHFDLSLARKQSANKLTSGDWLVLHIQELISLAYQISTIQFENMRPIGVGLLSAIIDKFERSPDPELPGHLLLEQYQAQLISAVRTALDVSSGPILLETGLQLATKMMTTGILGGDQVAVKRIFSLISRPLDNFNDVFYPSFAEWVSFKIKVRLLAAHASLKCYTFAFLRRHQSGVPDEYLALLPLFSKSSSILGKYWIQVLRGYSCICLHLNLKEKWDAFLGGILSPLVSLKLQPTLEEVWPIILQALALDAVPANIDGSSELRVENAFKSDLISGYSMVELEMEDYQFLWGFALLILFQHQQRLLNRQIVPISSTTLRSNGDILVEEKNANALKQHEIVLPVFQFLSLERFFTSGFLTIEICQELLQVFSFSISTDNSWNSLAISVLSQILQNCPEEFLGAESFAYLAVELVFSFIFNIFSSVDVTSSDFSNWEELISPLFIMAKTLVSRFEPKKQLKSVVLALILLGYRRTKESSTEQSFSIINDFLKCANLLMKKLLVGCSENGEECMLHLHATLGACLSVIINLTKDCIKGIHLLENKRTDPWKLLQLKLSFSLEQTFLLAKHAYEVRFLGETEDSNLVCFTMFKDCTENMQFALNDSNIQVQAIGLQVLKNMAQRCTSIEETAFVLFLCGELAMDILNIIQTILKKPTSKEAVTMASECLRFVALLLTLSKASESQRGFMNLLLKVIFMVFLASEDDPSKEVNDIRTAATRVVSQLAQIPSLAVRFKDVLLSMPAAQRQQLQGIIRASVTQDHSVTQSKPILPLEIKLPAPKDPSSVISVPVVNTSKEVSSNPVVPLQSDHNDEEVETDEDEDDWDTFQSFPTSTSAPLADLKIESVDEKSVSDTKSESDQFEAFTNEPIKNENVNYAKHPVADEEEVTLSKNSVANPHKDQNQKKEEETMSSCNRGEEAESNQENPEVSFDLQSVEPTNRLSQVNPEEDYDQRKGSLGGDADLQSKESTKVHVTEEVIGDKEHDHSLSDTWLPKKSSDNAIQGDVEDETDTENHVVAELADEVDEQKNIELEHANDRSHEHRDPLSKAFSPGKVSDHAISGVDTEKDKKAELADAVKHVETEDSKENTSDELPELPKISDQQKDDPESDVKKTC